MLLTSVVDTVLLYDTWTNHLPLPGILPCVLSAFH
jgi:hypothetical protein